MKIYIYSPYTHIVFKKYSDIDPTYYEIKYAEYYDSTSFTSESFYLMSMRKKVNFYVFDPVLTLPYNENIGDDLDEYLEDYLVENMHVWYQNTVPTICLKEKAKTFAYPINYDLFAYLISFSKFQIAEANLFKPLQYLTNEYQEGLEKIKDGYINAMPVLQIQNSLAIPINETLYQNLTGDKIDKEKIKKLINERK